MTKFSNLKVKRVRSNLKHTESKLVKKKTTLKGRNAKKATIIQVSRRKRNHAKRQHAKRHHAKSQHAKRYHAKRHNAKRQHAKRHNAKSQHAKRHHAKRHKAKRQHAKRHNAKRQHAKRHHKKGNLPKGHHVRSLLRIQAWILNSIIQYILAVLRTALLVVENRRQSEDDHTIWGISSDLRQFCLQYVLNNTV